jgi:hypothetical protein
LSFLPQGAWFFGLPSLFFVSNIYAGSVDVADKEITPLALVAVMRP